MIVVGLRIFSKLLGTLGAPTLCLHCGSSCCHQVVRDRHWFTLFFLPVFPVWQSYSLVCPNCGGAQRLKRREAMAMLEHGQRL